MTSLKDTIRERLDDGERIVALARKHAAPVARRLDEAGDMSAEEAEATLERQAARLEAANDTLRLAYEAYEGQVNGQDTATLNHRAAGELERILWHAQGRIAEPHGPETLKLYGLEESPPAGHRALATYAHNAVTLLRAHPQRLEGQFGDHLETTQIAEVIEGPLDALADYLASLDDAPGQLKGALARRDLANDQWMRIWRGASTILEGVFLLAERGDLAARVRPRLPGVIVDEDASVLADIHEDEIELTSDI